MHLQLVVDLISYWNHMCPEDIRIMIAQKFDGVTRVMLRNKPLLLPFMTSAVTNKDLMFWHGRVIIILARFSIKLRLRHEKLV